ncbi:alb1 domain-containing protein [Purpureocillium lavendulum]|uniref:Alb1 domain-containing protein n=1 Tax=Purpureocillium lavendulum TaxID=1247861 RepID=A0AB34FNK1_9HYPO|nr:alb1 domain-containing protein [Purpureocillium lavendulum]
MPSCITQDTLYALPNAGEVHSVYRKAASTLVTYTSGLHIWHFGHRVHWLEGTSEHTRLPLLEAEHSDQRILLATEVRRALDENDEVRFDKVWKKDPRVQDNTRTVSTPLVFPCFTGRYMDASHTLFSTTAPNDGALADVKAVRMAWKGGGTGRSRPMTDASHRRLCARFGVSWDGKDPLQLCVVEHAISYTFIMLCTTTEDVCIQLGVALGLTAFTDDHDKGTHVDGSGIESKVVDALRKGLQSKARHCFDDVINTSQLNEVMRELQLYSNVLAHREPAVCSWYNYVMNRAAMVAIHPIVELAASIGEKPIPPHHHGLAIVGATIAHDLCDLRYDITKGVCLNSVYVLGTALPSGHCPECIAECLVPMIIHSLLSANTPEGRRMAGAVAGCGFLRSYCFSMYRDLLNARATLLEHRCDNAWSDAINILRTCEPELLLEVFLSSGFTEVCEDIRGWVQASIEAVPIGDKLINVASVMATASTDNAEDVEKAWTACIGETATALVDYLNADARHLEGLVWSAMINSCLTRLSMHCGSIRHATNNAHNVPGWQLVVARHSHVPD